MKTMLEKKYDANILILSIPIAILTTIVSYAGIFIDSTYAKETTLYASQGIGQDIVNLFVVVPILIVAALFAYHKSRSGLFVWSGAIFYLAF